MSEIVFVKSCVIFVDHVHIVAHGTQEFVKKKDNLRIEVCHQRKLVMLDRQLSLFFFYTGLLSLSLIR